MEPTIQSTALHEKDQCPAANFFLSVQGAPSSPGKRGSGPPTSSGSSSSQGPSGSAAKRFKAANATPAGGKGAEAAGKVIKWFISHFVKNAKYFLFFRLLASPRSRLTSLCLTSTHCKTSRSNECKSLPSQLCPRMRPQTGSGPLLSHIAPRLLLRISRWVYLLCFSVLHIEPSLISK